MKKKNLGALTPEKTEATLLQTVFKTADTGIKALEALTIYAQDKDFCILLVNQIKGYRGFANNTREKIIALGENPDDLCPTGTIMIKTSVFFHCLMSKETPKLARMAYQGASMAVIKINHYLNLPLYRDVPNEIARELLAFSEACMAEYVPFL